MTLDQAVALSLLPSLPRVGLTGRLRAGDPELLELADRQLSHACEVRRRAAADNIAVVPWNAAPFPQALLTLPDCPPVLWYRGRLDTLDAPAVAIVGARAASAVGMELAARIAHDLARVGLTVVSGLARGVDSAAHRGALKAGRTAAVLGSGVDTVYPSEHAALAAEIAVDGMVLSEYPPGTPPLAFHFPQRNRLISGLARAVVVIEASERSGSLITAACALEQGREVLAVPGNALSGRNRGGHALIRDGAKIVESADDIVQELGLVLAPASGGGPPGPGLLAEDPVARLFEPGQVHDLDALVAASGLDTARVLARLLDLELAGLVRRVGGGRFIRPSRPC